MPKIKTERIMHIKNRTIIGIIYIVVALIVTFAVAPVVNRLADSKVDIVRMTRNVAQGHQISEGDVEVVKVIVLYADN